MQQLIVSVSVSVLVYHCIAKVIIFAEECVGITTSSKLCIDFFPVSERKSFTNEASIYLCNTENLAIVISTFIVVQVCMFIRANPIILTILFNKYLNDFD